MQQWIEGSTAWQDSFVHSSVVAPWIENQAERAFLTTNFIMCQIKIRDDPSQPRVSHCSESSSHCEMCGLSASVHDGATLHAHLAKGARKTIETTTMAKENRGLRMLKIDFPVDLLHKIPGGQLFHGSLWLLTERTHGNSSTRGSLHSGHSSPQVSHTPHEKIMKQKRN